MLLVFTLPNGRRVSHGAYVRAWRALQTLAPCRLVPGFEHFPTAARDILASIRAGVLERVNRHDRSFARGRKWSADYQALLSRDARRINDYARGIRQSGRNLLSVPELKRDYPRIDTGAFAP
jgi:hypothetical protein